MSYITCCIYCGHMVDVNNNHIMMLHRDRNGKQCYGGRRPATGTIAQASKPIITAESVKVNVK